MHIHTEKEYAMPLTRRRMEVVGGLSGCLLVLDLAVL